MIVIVRSSKVNEKKDSSKLRVLTSLEQGTSIKETSFDPSQAFKKNKPQKHKLSDQVNKEYDTRKKAQSTQNRGLSSKRDFIDKSNLNIPKFSEDLTDSKVTENSWLNEDKVKQLQIKITPYKKTGSHELSDEKGHFLRSSKHSLPPNKTTCSDQDKGLSLFKSEQFDMESDNIMDIIRQENDKMGGVQTKKEEETPLTGVEKVPFRTDTTRNKFTKESREKSETRRQRKKQQMERSPLHKKSNMKNLLLKINKKLTRESKSSFKTQKSDITKEPGTQKSPLLVKKIIIKTPDLEKLPKKRSTQPKKIIVAPVSFSSSESSSDSDSSRSSNDSTSSSGSSGGSTSS
jgi:hypothetical protein